MLDELPTQRSSRWVFRLAKDPTFDFLTSLGLDSRAEAELREALAAAPAAASAEQLCEAVFRPKRRLRRRTRYSDGSFPVFYSSLNVETAEAEVKHWLPVVMGRPNDRPNDLLPVPGVHVLGPREGPSDKGVRMAESGSRD